MFFQSPPELGNQFQGDRVLRGYLARVLPDDMRRAIEPSLVELGELSGGELYRMQLEDRLNEPRLTTWDPWGRRIDKIDVTPLWQRAKRVACEAGVVATAYERKSGAFSRVHQFALAYLVDASWDVYSCPLAMTDGAAKTLLSHGRTDLVERAVTRLTSRDPDFAWTSGQWMTERTGGSDVGLTETIARPRADDRYALHGTKWFSSATTSEMALTLARPEGNPPGGRGLALFYVEIVGRNKDENRILVNRLKDKLGTRKVPTAELTLEGALATPVAGLSNGVRNIAPMLNVTRVWNAIGAISGMRRGIALAEDYAERRVQFGLPIAQKPLHRDTLLGMTAEFEGAFALTMRVVELLGKEEAGEITDNEGKLLRLLTPITKLTTAKQGVEVVSEALECFGGAGYVEDTGLPRLLRDAQVLPIWEGTTNVLSLDVLRVLAKDRPLEALAAEVHELVATAKDARLAACGAQAERAIVHAGAWLGSAKNQAEPLLVEAGARRLAMTIGRAVELALLVRQASFDLEHGQDPRTAASAARFAAHGVDRIVDGL